MKKIKGPRSQSKKQPSLISQLHRVQRKVRAMPAEYDKKPTRER